MYKKGCSCVQLYQICTLYFPTEYRFTASVVRCIIGAKIDKQISVMSIFIHNLQ